MSLPKDAVSRTNLSLIGIDILTIRGASAVTRALQTGELSRFTDVIDTIDDASWLFRWFFPLSRFFSGDHGFFMPFRGDADPTFPPCRAFLETKFAPGHDISEHVYTAARLIADPNKLPSDKELSAVFARAIACRFVTDGVVPDKIIDAAHSQIGDIGESFLPWKFIPARGAVASVYDFFARQLKTTGPEDLPAPGVTDVSHSVLATMLHGAAVLREISAHVDEEIEVIMARLGRVENVLRMATRETTLGGLVPGGSTIRPGKTIVILDIRRAATETGDVAWAFGTGTTVRRCAAEGAILEFFRAVQAEVKNMREENQ